MSFPLSNVSSWKHLREGEALFNWGPNDQCLAFLTVTPSVLLEYSGNCDNWLLAIHKIQVTTPRSENRRLIHRDKLLIITVFFFFLWNQREVTMFRLKLIKNPSAFTMISVTMRLRILSKESRFIPKTQASWAVRASYFFPLDFFLCKMK